jgi:hypothetical protein
METERAKRLAGFVSWVGANIKGDEKGEAQVFLDRFFQALGHAGLKEAGATLEERIKKAEGRGTAFPDLVWKPVVLIEMKKRGEDLTRHCRQAFEESTRRTSGRHRADMTRKVDPFKPWIGCDGQGRPPEGRKTIGSSASPLSHGKDPSATRSENSVGCRLLKSACRTLMYAQGVLVSRVAFSHQSAAARSLLATLTSSMPLVSIRW